MAGEANEQMVGKYCAENHKDLDKTKRKHKYSCLLPCFYKKMMWKYMGQYIQMLDEKQQSFLFCCFFNETLFCDCLMHRSFLWAYNGAKG